MSESFKNRFGKTVLNNKIGYETFRFGKSIKLINGKIKNNITMEIILLAIIFIVFIALNYSDDKYLTKDNYNIHLEH